MDGPLYKRGSWGDRFIRILKDQLLGFSELYGFSEVSGSSTIYRINYLDSLNCMGLFSEVSDLFRFLISTYLSKLPVVVPFFQKINQFSYPYSPSAIIQLIPRGSGHCISHSFAPKNLSRRQAWVTLYFKIVGSISLTPTIFLMKRKKCD